jgi:DDE family transposase
MASSPPAQLSFPPVAGHTVRADCGGGALSADCGGHVLRGLDRQSGRTARRAAAIHKTRPPSSLAHPLRDLLAPRLSPIASGDADGNAANSLRPAPLWPLGVERPPLAPAPARARAPTVSRLAHGVDR